MKTGKNKDLNYQMKLLEEILLKNNNIKLILERLQDFGLKNYYLAAGAVSQTVFNYIHGYPLDNEINDYDIVYYDSDKSYEKEDLMIKEITNLFKDVNIKLDIKNQARVHLWYGKKFKHDIKENKSVEEAISKWGTTISCIGVRLENNKLIIFAPFGLNDLFSMLIRPNKKDFIKKDYDIKTKRWKNIWPNLTIIPWE